MSFDPTPYLGREFNHDHWNCWTLVATVLNEQFGLSVPTATPRGACPDDRAGVQATIDAEKRRYLPIDGPPSSGDLVLLRIYREVCHVAIIHSPRRALHVMERTSTHIIDLASAEWRQRVFALYRHPDLADVG